MISDEAQKNVEEIYHIALLGAIETNKTSGEFVRNSKKKPKPTSWADTQMEKEMWFLIKSHLINFNFRK